MEPGRYRQHGMQCILEHEVPVKVFAGRINRLHGKL
jgi:hypothetical protein